MIRTLAGLLLTAACFAQQPPNADVELTADRPGYGGSTDTVAPGFLQLESGMTLDNTSSDGQHTRTLGGPGMLLRVPVASWMEFRASTDGIQYERDYTPGAASMSHAGFADVTIGAKFRLASQKGRRPAMALITELTFPTGSGGLSDGGYNPELEFSWAEPLPRGFSAGGNINLWWAPKDTGGSPGHAQSLSIGHALPAKLQGYAEIYHVAPTPGADTPSWNWDTGISRLIGRNTQLDLEAGHSLMARVSDWFVGGGVVFRFSTGH